MNFEHLSIHNCPFCNSKLKSKVYSKYNYIDYFCKKSGFAMKVYNNGDTNAEFYDKDNADKEYEYDYDYQYDVSGYRYYDNNIINSIVNHSNDIKHLKEKLTKLYYSPLQ